MMSYMNYKEGVYKALAYINKTHGAFLSPQEAPIITPSTTRLSLTILVHSLKHLWHDPFCRLILN